MNANKVTVAMLKAAGFEMAAGDTYFINGVKVKLNEVTACSLNRDGFHSFDGCDREINHLAPRVNTGSQPVGDNCVVEATRNDGCVIVRNAKEIDWSLLKFSVAIKTWKPSLKHLEQQMNIDKSALELTERDIEDAFIQQENASVERELAESDAITLDFRPEVAARDKLIELGYGYVDGEWLTPREEFIKKVSGEIFGETLANPNPKEIEIEKRTCDIAAAYIYDNNYYRK